MNWLAFSQDSYLVAFFLFCIGFISFVFTVAGRKMKTKDPAAHEQKWGRISFSIALLGFVAQLAYFITRWIGGGHIPVSNMYEFMSFLAMMIIGAYIVIFFIYRSYVMGVFALPLAVLIMAYASVFPSEVQPLIPQLDSIWLKIHVTLAAAGEAFFAIGFVAGLMYLIRTIQWDNSSAKRAQRSLEVIMVLIMIIVGFVAVVFGYRSADYEVAIDQRLETVDNQGQINSTIETIMYKMPPLIAPYQGEVKEDQKLLGIKLPLLEAPKWMEGAQAGRKLNTVAWSILSGLLLYGIVRLIIRKPIARALQPLLSGLDPEDLDEISYRANAIGFPVFTLGGLIFAMIWAQIAWSRFWAWDPKEVWALITWLFYSAYLHLRLSRGYIGAKSSWLSVIGFIIVMFTLLGVNLIISGLHSYAGV